MKGTEILRIATPKGASGSPEQRQSDSGDDNRRDNRRQRIAPIPHGKAEQAFKQASDQHGADHRAIAIRCCDCGERNHEGEAHAHKDR